MSVYLILLLALLVGAVLLAHHMGREIGYEYGYTDAEHDILCGECRQQKLEGVWR